MRRRPAPDFDSWLQYTMEHGHTDFMGMVDFRDEARVQRVQRFAMLEPVVVTGYLTRLFRESGHLMGRSTLDQIARATWLIFSGGGFSSDSISCLWHKRVPTRDAQECVRSMKWLYTDCFDRLCETNGTSSGSALSPSRDLEIAVYMLWDLGPLDLRPCQTQRGKRLGEAALEVIEVALLQCDTEACRSSALHAIGHGIGMLEFREPRECDPALDAEFVHRLNELVRRFLEKSDVTPLLRDYATQALKGTVM